MHYTASQVRPACQLRARRRLLSIGMRRNEMMSSKNEKRAGAIPPADEAAVPLGGEVRQNGRNRRALIGSGLAGLAGTLLVSTPAGAHDGDGPLSNATVTFGSWMLPLDRHPGNFPRTANHHHLCPDEVKVKV